MFSSSSSSSSSVFYLGRRLAEGLRPLLRRDGGRPGRREAGRNYFCTSELIQLVTVSSQSTCKDATQPLQGLNMVRRLAAALLRVDVGAGIREAVRVARRAAAGPSEYDIHGRGSAGRRIMLV